MRNALEVFAEVVETGFKITRDEWVKALAVAEERAAETRILVAGTLLLGRIAGAASALLEYAETPEAASALVGQAAERSEAAVRERERVMLRLSEERLTRRVLRDGVPS